MKSIIASLLIVVSFSAHAGNKKAITYEILQEQAEKTCREDLCAEWEAEGGECDFSDGGEIALQECAGDLFWELVDQYNQNTFFFFFFFFFFFGCG